ncbi:MAG: NAD(P)-dependent oxidoreductase [Hyphomonadaceae bacterium]
MARYKRLLITGATGMLGSVMRKELTEIADIVRLSALHEVTDLADHEEQFACDLADKEAVMELTKGVDAVVHMGGVSKEATFDEILHSNIVGFYNLYEACRKNGVKRVTWASSVHAIGFYPTTKVVDTDVPLRPDSNYGVSKAFGEALAQYYWDKFHLESVSVRIYSSFPKPTDRRHLNTYLSFRDCAECFRRSLLAPVVGHTVIYGVSDNKVKLTDNRKAAHIGYQPQDSTEAFREHLESTLPEPACDDPFIARHGGGFAADGHFED